MKWFDAISEGEILLYIIQIQTNTLNITGILQKTHTHTHISISSAQHMTIIYSLFFYFKRTKKHY